MLYNLLFSATFLKDFSHLQGPPEGIEWSDFKKNTFAYVIQKQEDSITKSGKKHLFYISNQNGYLAFGIYTSIHDYAKLGRVDKEYELRRRGGDHSVHQTDPTKGDYPTEASIGAFWFKKDTGTLSPGKFVDMDIDKLLKIYEQEIPPFWARRREDPRQEVPDIVESPLKISNAPTYRVNGIKKIIAAINSGKKLLLKVSEKAEINLFYALVHAVINGDITANFNFSTAFKTKKFFAGQRVITVGTLRVKGAGVVRASAPYFDSGRDNLNPRSYFEEPTDEEELEELEEELGDDLEGDLEDDLDELDYPQTAAFPKTVAYPQTTAYPQTVAYPKTIAPQPPVATPPPAPVAPAPVVTAPAPAAKPVAPVVATPAPAAKPAPVPTAQEQAAKEAVQALLENKQVETPTKIVATPQPPQDAKQAVADLLDSEQQEPEKKKKS
ncbi:MAG: hypothetical protein FWD76_01695, partial [Firmicutes bacterium]|nr:hypothetical protein [Bacillota bacterium]